MRDDPTVPQKLQEGEGLMSSKPWRAWPGKERARNQGPLTILGTRFVLSELLDELEQWGSRPLRGGKSGVTKQYGVFASCHGKEENGHIMSPLESRSHSSHTRGWLFG